MSHSKTNRNNDADDSTSSDESTESDDPDGNSGRVGPVDRVANSHGETAAIQEKGGGGRKERIKEYLRGSGIVYRAMNLLEEWKYMTARISSTKVPVDIIALRKDVVLLVQVISSRRAIPDAKALLRHFAGKIQNLRSMGTLFQFRKILMAYSRSGGWMTYDVYPNGLAPARNIAAVPDS